MTTIEEEASAFADNFIKALPFYEEMMADPTTKRVEKIADDARTAFYKKYGPVPQTNSPEDIALRRRLEEDGKQVYEAARRAAVEQELHKVNREYELARKQLQEQDENEKKEEEELLACSNAELLAKLKELFDGHDEIIGAWVK